MSTYTATSDTSTSSGIDTMWETARTTGAADAEDGADPQDGSPPGHDQVLSCANTARNSVRIHQRQEKQERHHAADDARQHLLGLQNDPGDRIRWDTITSPGLYIATVIRTGTPYLALASLLGVETVLVTNAFAEVFNSEATLDSPAGAAAFIVTGGAAFAGHLRARADQIADTTNDATRYSRAASTTNAMQFAILGAATAAMLARIRSELIGGDAVDGWELATFGVFQVILVLLAIHVPRYAVDKHREVAADIRRRATITAEATVAGAEKAEVEVAEAHAAEDTRLEDGLYAALRFQTLELARLHPSFQVGSEWRRWLDANLPARPTRYSTTTGGPNPPPQPPGPADADADQDEPPTRTDPLDPADPRDDDQPPPAPAATPPHRPSPTPNGQHANGNNPHEVIDLTDQDRPLSDESNLPTYTDPRDFFDDLLNPDDTR
jgi:hypothetical protein